MHKSNEVKAMLSELASLDEVNAWVPTGKDHDAGVTPQWCELVLEIEREHDDTLEGEFPVSARLPLRRHDGELIIESLFSALHPNAGGSIRHMLWSELDDVVDAIQKRVAKGKEPLKRDAGMALGLATAIAIMTNPYAYDVDEVRGEAMERWEARQAHRTGRH